jgi:hypothetical protein
MRSGNRATSFIPIAAGFVKYNIPHGLDVNFKFSPVLLASEVRVEKFEALRKSFDEFAHRLPFDALPAVRQMIVFATMAISSTAT